MVCTGHHNGWDCPECQTVGNSDRDHRVNQNSTSGGRAVTETYEDLQNRIKELQRKLAQSKSDHRHARQQCAQIAKCVPGATWTEIQASLRSYVAIADDALRQAEGRNYNP